MHKSGRARAVAEGLALTSIWGFGFVATKWAMGAWPAGWLTVARFALPVAVTLPFVPAFPALRQSAGVGQFKLAFLPGLLLGGILLFQTLGLSQTSVANSSFITTLYVVMVPLLAAGFKSGSVTRRHWLMVALALLGTALICRVESLALNVGDLWTLGCALIASVHMLVLEKRGPRVQSPLVFNLYQSSWAALLSLAAALVMGVPLPSVQALTTGWEPVFGLLFVAGPCTLVGFALQVSAQRALPASVAALIFLLESPFAALAGWLVLGEGMTPTQLLGAALILAAAAGAAIPSS